jgi:hypothetical protein
MSLLRRFVWRLRVRLFRGYLLVCDDRGTTRWPSKSKTWCIGGYVIPYWNRYQLIEVWRSVKDELTADPSSELKWSHFFSGPHQEFSENPLISKNQIIWREQAKWALDQLTDVTGLVPINTRVRKDQASDELFVDFWNASEHKNYRVLDIDTLWIPVLGSLALLLRQKRSLAEVWFDQMGSRSEEERRQVSWLELRDGEWKVNLENQQMMKAISPEIRFYDSRKSDLVQIADMISGVIWAASEEDEEFLQSLLEKYFPLGMPSYTLVSIR